MRCSPKPWRPLLASILAILLIACDTVAFPAPPDDLAEPTAGEALIEAPSPTAAPLPTALPAPELLARARQRRTLGEYDGMAEDARALLDNYPEAEEARAARFYLAESYALRGRWTSAVEALRDFVEGEPHDDLQARALFLLARGHEQAG
ncbi:MAG TPA: tetratricopeptide repeat protein, partial [Roseiflexaceae bacterium]|nr:tetratricopeptide repeat protein [Roseiflexaceae bacterium]